MLKVIERVTRQRITVEKLPTIADLHARRLEMTRAALHESLLGDDLERFRVVVETLADEFDVMEVALAAVKLAHEASGAAAAEEEEIPELGPRPEAPRRERGPGPGRDSRSGPGRGTTRLYVGAGRTAGVRPQDLVGAIAGEAGLPSSRIGAIQIADGYSLVEVPEDAADAVVTALKSATLRGKRVPVRRERG